nr:MAG TPA: helix-turn-helix domain protein [Crassvirales sp.]
MQEKLILLKEQNKMTNKKMAEILGITPNQYRKKEKGEVQFKLNEMVNLSEYFGKTMDEIFLPSKHQNGANN